MARAQNPTNAKIPHASSNVKPGFETAYFVNKSSRIFLCTSLTTVDVIAHRFRYCTKFAVIPVKTLSGFVNTTHYFKRSCLKVAAVVL
jgi:hypothetical protein